MRIEQHFLMTNYSLWEVILNGDSPVPTRVVDGVLQPVAPTTAEQRLARKNELKAHGTMLIALPDKHQLKFNYHKDAKTLMEAIEKRFRGNTETKKTDLEEHNLDDLFNSLKIYEAEVMSSSTASTTTQNISFVSSSHTNNTTEPASAAASVFAISAKIPITPLPNIDADDLEEMDLKCTTEPTSAAASVFAISAKIPITPLPNVDSLSNAVIYLFFSSQSNSPQLDNDDLKQIDADDLEEMDLKWQMAMLTVRARRFLQTTRKNLGANGPTSMGFDMSKVECYNYHRKGHFTRECRSPKDSIRNGSAEPQRRNVPVETSTSNALVSQCDGVGSYDWSFQAEEEPTNYALMVFSSSSSSSDNEVVSCLKAYTKAYAQLQSYYDKLTANFQKSQFDVISYQTIFESVEARLLVYKQNEYVFKEDIKLLKLEVQLRENALVRLRQTLKKAEQERDDLKLKLEKFQTSSKNLTASQTNSKTGLGYNSQVFTRAMFDCDGYLSSGSDESFPFSPIYDRYQLDNRYHVVPPPYIRTFLPPKPDLDFNNAPNAVKTNHPAFNNVPSFVQPTEQVKSPRHFVQHVKTSIPPKNAIPKPTTVVIQSKPVPITIVRPVSTAVPKISVTRPRHAKPIVTKPNSPPKRHINRSPSLKASNSPPRVTAVKAPIVNATQGMQGGMETKMLNFKPCFPQHKCINDPKKGNPQHALQDKEVIASRCSRHMTINMSYQCDFKELNGGYVAFGGNPKGGFDEVLSWLLVEGYLEDRLVKEVLLMVLVMHTEEEDMVLHIEKTGMLMLVGEVDVGGMTDDEGEYSGTSCLPKIVPTSYSRCSCHSRAMKILGPKEKLTILFLVQGNPQHALKDKGVIDSGWSRYITGNMSYLSDFKELNSGYVEFGGNPKGGKISRKGKFDGKVDEGFLAGYSISSKAFRVFNSGTSNCTRDLAWEESDQQYVLFLVWSFGSTNPQNTDGDAAFDEKEPEFEGKKPESEVNVSPSSSAQSKKHDDKTKREAKGKSPVESLTGYINLSAEFEDFFNNDINEVNVAGTLVPAIGQLSPNITNTFSATGPSNAAASLTHGKSSSTQTRSMIRVAKDQAGLSQINSDDFHTCMFACFLSQGEPKRKVLVLVDLPYGKRAIGTEWGFRNKKDERGIVVRNKARLVYVCQPPGFEDPNHLDKVYKVVKALYGSHQAPRAWYETLANYLLENGFQRGEIDQTLFIKRQKGDILLVQIYVKQKKDGIFISQDKYVAEILRKFGLTDGKSASTPIDTEKPLLKDPDGEDVDVHTYKSMIGSLIKEDFRCLKGKPHLGLWYLKDSPFDLVAYSDSDYAGASLDKKSTTRGCQFLRCRLISWQCKKQTVMATSSTKAGYIAVVVLSSMESLKRMVHVTNILRQMATGKENSNPFMASSLPKTILLTFIHFWIIVVVKKVNDVTRLQALVDKKKVVVTEATIREAFHLDDAEGVKCLTNEEIFVELARIGYEKPSTKITFYKAFFSSQWKFLIHTILQCMSANRTSWNEFSSSMASVVIFLSTDVNVDNVSIADVATEGNVSAANDEVPTDVEEPSIPSPTPPTQSPQPSQDIPSTSQIAQAMEIIKLKSRVKKLERRNKASKLKRLKKVGSAQRIDTSNDTVMDDVSNQGKRIVDMDADVDVVLKDTKDVAIDFVKDVQDANVEYSAHDQGRQAESQAKIYKIDLEHAKKVLNMQDEEESEPIEL
nr:hypothetical protein [Tanacetum cinerariifolium]